MAVGRAFAEPAKIRGVSTRVLLIRHGLSEWNELGRWQGQADPPLAAAGRRDARGAVASLGAIDAIVASPLLRAAETAAILAEGIGVGPVFADARLMERSAGPWEGLTRTEIETTWPGHLADGRRPDGWESDEALVTRAMAALDDLAGERRGSSIAVVTHSGLIMAVERALGDPAGRMPNLGGRPLTHDDRSWSLEERVELVGAADAPGVLE